MNLNESFKFPLTDRNIHIGVYSIADKTKVIGKCLFNPKECNETSKIFNLKLENCPDKNASLKVNAVLVEMEGKELLKQGEILTVRQNEMDSNLKSNSMKTLPEKYLNRKASWY